MPGTLAERIVVPAAFAWPVPDDWGDGDAVCAEPLTVALAAVRRAMAAPGRRPRGRAERCLVIGAGSQGTLACVALTACGISPAVLDPHPGRAALATELGRAGGRGGRERVRPGLRDLGGAGGAGRGGRAGRRAAA